LGGTDYDVAVLRYTYGTVVPQQARHISVLPGGQAIATCRRGGVARLTKAVEPRPQIKQINNLHRLPRLIC